MLFCLAFHRHRTTTLVGDMYLCNMSVIFGIHSWYPTRFTAYTGQTDHEYDKYVPPRPFPGRRARFIGEEPYFMIPIKADLFSSPAFTYISLGRQYICVTRLLRKSDRYHIIGKGIAIAWMAYSWAVLFKATTCVTVMDLSLGGYNSSGIVSDIAINFFARSQFVNP